MDVKGPKVRADLILSEQEAGGETQVVVKDPESGRYFRFGDVEHFIIRHLDGGHSPEKIQERFQARFDALPSR